MGNVNEVIRRSHIEQGLTIHNNKPGCKLAVYATWIGEDEKIGPLKMKIAELDFDNLIKGCPDALFITLVVEHVDDLTFKPVEV